MNDIDFEQFIKLLDGALASDDKNVKNALRKFLFVAALALGDDVEPGPFTQMMETIDNLQRRISILESQKTYTQQTDPTTTTPWVYTTPITYPNTGAPWTTAGGTGTGWTSGSVTNTAGTTFTNTTTSVSTGNPTYPFFGDDKTGTKIKDSIKGKLKGLVKAA
jgi:hypothetical protein